MIVHLPLAGNGRVKETCEEEKEDLGSFVKAVESLEFLFQGKTQDSE